MRRFVIIGQKASAGDDFRLDDLPSTSGRLDVLLRCLRAALLFSHGMRPSVVVDLVLLGGAHAPRIVRIDASAVKFIRPDERSLAILLQKALRSASDAGAARFVEVRPGIAVRRGGLAETIADLGEQKAYFLSEEGTDLREVVELGSEDEVFFVGDHLGFDESTRTQLMAVGARSVGVGPVSLHAEDAIAVLWNELDRRAVRSLLPTP